MAELSLLPAPKIDLNVTRELADRAETRMLSPARERGYELRLVGATVLPQRQVIARSPWGTWLFVDYVEDPTAAEYGGRIPVPAAEHAKLTELAKAGVRPDLLWVAHQLPDTWQEGDGIPQLVPAPAHLREKDQRLVRRLTTATKIFLGASGAVLGAALTPLAVLAAAGAGLDPVVLGGVRHPEVPAVQWALLAQWDWE
jgi:hypothetical protein